MLIYTVLPNDSVDSIANAHGISAESIIYNNQISYPYSLAIGQALLLTDTAGEISAPPKLCYVGGYAYPSIDNEVLNKTLPYLSGLFVFSYGFTTDGYLIPPQTDDTWMLFAAKDYGVAPVLTLTPFGPDGQYNNYLVTRMINNKSSRINLISQLTHQVLEHGFEGVDINFEYLLAEDRIPFANFVMEVRTAMNALGVLVSVALAPKISDTQTGPLYEGKDYALLGEAADFVLLTTYEWGYTYGPPMAVAPINKVHQVLEYALTRIPAAKIQLGIPNYGYEWTLPFIRGTSKAKTIGNADAVEIAVHHNAAILFDASAQSPYFRYKENDILHEVWFEDVRSIQKKFSLVKEYQLRGMGYWQIMPMFRPNWILLSQEFSIAEVSTHP